MRTLITPVFMCMLAATCSLASMAVAQEDSTVTADPTAPASAPSLSEVTPATGLSNDTITDKKLDAFVQAVLLVGRVGTHYSNLAAKEADETKRTALVATANEDIVKAIDVTPDISPAEFLAIDQASQQDKVLNDRILAQIEVIRKQAQSKQPLRLPDPVETQ